ncbi:hypothetical protein LAUMK191_04003 [Mycobacterium attenuatum]|nr:hypothetical protein LAUMK191_04003 [Mycobacterium attenuatum]VBA60712.1 hypothetical protein LAUMK41_04143 [Mycobacterium attenuatum]
MSGPRRCRGQVPDLPFMPARGCNRLAGQGWPKGHREATLSLGRKLGLVVHVNAPILTARSGPTRHELQRLHIAGQIAAGTARNAISCRGLQEPTGPCASTVPAAPARTLCLIAQGDNPSRRTDQRSGAHERNRRADKRAWVKWSLGIGSWLARYLVVLVAAVHVPASSQVSNPKINWVSRAPGAVADRVAPNVGLRGSSARPQGGEPQSSDRAKARNHSTDESPLDRADHGVSSHFSSTFRAALRQRVLSATSRNQRVALPIPNCVIARTL